MEQSQNKENIFIVERDHSGQWHCKYSIFVPWWEDPIIISECPSGCSVGIIYDYSYVMDHIYENNSLELFAKFFKESIIPKLTNDHYSELITHIPAGNVFYYEFLTKLGFERIDVFNNLRHIKRKMYLMKLTLSKWED